MKKVILVTCVMISILALVTGAQDIKKVSAEKEQAIIGSWAHYDFYYLFDESGTMTAVQVDSEPLGYRQFTYSMLRMGPNNFIEYGEKNTGKNARNLILVDDFLDSSAVFASGTPFVRADSSEGILGVWKHVKAFTAMICTITPDSVYYTETIFDYGTGKLRTVDSSSGRYTREKPEKRMFENGWSGGRFRVFFNDNKQGTLLPVVNGDLMYLFDLRPVKSKFVRVNPDSVPTYNDYRMALKSKKVQGKR